MLCPIAEWCECSPDIYANQTPSPSTPSTSLTALGKQPTQSRTIRIQLIPSPSLSRKDRYYPIQKTLEQNSHKHSPPSNLPCCSPCTFFFNSPFSVAVILYLALLFFHSFLSVFALPLVRFHSTMIFQDSKQINVFHYILAQYHNQALLAYIKYRFYTDFSSGLSLLQGLASCYFCHLTLPPRIHRTILHRKEISGP